MRLPQPGRNDHRAAVTSPIGGTLTIGKLSVSEGGTRAIEADTAVNGGSATVNIGTIISSGALVAAIGTNAVANGLAAFDPGDTYGATSGGIIVLSVNPSSTSQRAFNGGTIAFRNPTGTITAALTKVTTNARDTRRISRGCVSTRSSYISG